MSTLCVIGCGAMGGAIMQRLPATPFFTRVIIADADPAALPPPAFDCITWPTAAACAAGTAQPVDVLLLAVKPQAFAALAPTLAPLCGAGTVVVSVMAGLSAEQIAAQLPPVAAVVRTMPNLAGTCAVFGTWPDDVTQVITALFGAGNHVLYVPSQGLAPAVTAVSGSGMAYFFALTEALAQAGTAAGLDATQAQQFARQTLYDAAALAAQHTAHPLEQLRQRITSKGGTTHAALEVLQQGNALGDLMTQAVAAACARSAALAAGG